MEREILFRGKQLDNGEWVEGFLLAFEAGQINEGRCFILPFASSVRVELGSYAFGGFVEVDPATVGQYTGMPDKNGTKIFEGDLLKYTGYEDDTPYRVFWKNTGWHIQYKNRQPDSLGISLPEDWEIIGNIYDNPKRIIRAPRLTELEIAIMRAVGAKWVSRDEGFDDVFLWSDKPKVSEDNEGYYLSSKLGNCITSIRARLFPSVNPGECVEMGEKDEPEAD